MATQYERYKDSGIYWLPSIPSHWSVVRFGSLFKRKPAINAPEEELLSVFLDKGVIKAVESEKRTHQASEDLGKYQLVEPNDFVMNNQQAWRGSVGVSEYRGIISPAYHIFPMCSDYLPKYANYLLRDRVMVNLFDISSKGVGSIQRTLNFSWLNNGKCIIPPINEQEKIVSYLDKKITLIESCKCQRERELQTLNELKQAEIASVVTRGLNPNVPMKDSGIPWIGQIPAHWDMVRIKYLLEESKRKSVDGHEQSLSLSRTAGVIPYEEKENRTMQSESLIGAKIVDVGDVVFNRFKARLFAISSYSGVVSPDYAVYKGKGRANLRYLTMLFGTPMYRAAFDRKASGIGDGFSRLYTADLFSMYAIIPPLNEQNEIVAAIDARTSKIDELIISLNTEIERLSEYKQRLVSDVVTGQINVQDTL